VNKLSRSWSGLAFLAVAAACVPLLFVTLISTTVPRMLGGLPRVRLLTGVEAEELVNRLHGRSVATGENAIGTYAGTEGSATVYLSVYASDTTARSAEIRMEERIASGDFGFSHLNRMTVEGRSVASCIGVGQVHFFYSRGRCLYWLACDYAVARGALKDLLDRTAN
jgi:hypothetical protein